jgi:hypothetical protein
MHLLAVQDHSVSKARPSVERTNQPEDDACWSTSVSITLLHLGFSRIHAAQESRSRASIPHQCPPETLRVDARPLSAPRRCDAGIVKQWERWSGLFCEQSQEAESFVGQGCETGRAEVAWPKRRAESLQAIGKCHSGSESVRDLGPGLHVARKETLFLPVLKRGFAMDGCDGILKRGILGV